MQTTRRLAVLTVLAAVLIGRHCAGKAETVRSRQPLAGVLAFAGSGVLSGGCRCAAGGGSVGNEQLRAVHSGVHLTRCRLSTLGPLLAYPFRLEKSLRAGCIWRWRDSVLFYWNVLLRFMENSSSWHRVTPTAAVWQALAALVFLAALARALHVPQPGNGKTLCAAGLAAFALCLCWQLPYVLVLMSGLSWAAPAVWPEIFAGLGLCCVGGIGGACVTACLNGES